MAEYWCCIQADIMEQEIEQLKQQLAAAEQRAKQAEAYGALLHEAIQSAKTDFECVVSKLQQVWAELATYKRAFELASQYTVDPEKVMQSYLERAQAERGNE